MGPVKTVIFACVHNAGRSQMAAAFFNAMADERIARAVSAGTEPGERVHPKVMEAMREVGVDLSGAKPQRLTEEMARGAEVLVTDGVRGAMPVRSGTEGGGLAVAGPEGAERAGGSRNPGGDPGEG